MQLTTYTKQAGSGSTIRGEMMEKYRVTTSIVLDADMEITLTADRNPYYLVGPPMTSDEAIKLFEKIGKTMEEKL